MDNTKSIQSDSTQRLVTRSGVEVFAYPSRSAHSTFISMYVRTGSMHEGESQHGISHFLEHIVVRSIDRAMDGGLYTTLDELGVVFNAATSAEMTQFYIGGAPQHFRACAELLCRALAPIGLDAAQIDAERKRVKAEIREEDEAGSLRGFTAAAVWDGTSLATPITGTPSSVNRITLRALREHKTRSFTVENIFFVVSGRVNDGDLAALIDEIDKYELPHGERMDAVAPVPRNFAARGANVLVKNAPFAKMQFSFDVDMSRVSLQQIYLLYDIVVSADSSRFFTELSEQMGLFYDICGSIDVYRNIGSFSFSYELKEARIYEAAERTVELLRSYKEQVLPEGRCMKAGYVDNAPMLLDDPREMNYTMGLERHILGLGYRNIDERAAEYAAVTPEDIRRAAIEVFRSEGLLLTVKGSKRRIDVVRLHDIVAKL